MSSSRWIIFLFLSAGYSFSQSFAPAPGFPGSTAIYKDSSIISGWASGITVKRGYLDIAQPELGFADYGIPQNGLQVEDDSLIVVSLGDSGVAILTFNDIIIDGPGPDFAVFENGFADHYMEFAHVEVSSDGVNYFRFPSQSETPMVPQMTNFSFGNCSYVHNLAGKYRLGFGTPFDLSELSGNAGLDVNSVTHIRLVDVIGSTDQNLGTMDSFGNLINDPYPTAFSAGGFDLDGVAVINSMPLSVQEHSSVVDLFPNPSSGQFSLKTNSPSEVSITDPTGKIVLNSIFEESSPIFLDVPNGIYFVKIITVQSEEFVKLVIQK